MTEKLLPENKQNKIPVIRTIGDCFILDANFVNAFLPKQHLNLIVMLINISMGESFQDSS